MNRNEQLIQEARAFAERLFAADHSGHDFMHTLRVHDLAARIAREEGADETIARLAALLHDADDRKLFPATHETLGNARRFLQENSVPKETEERIYAIIRDLSFSVGRVPDTLEGQAVQDADRLDAIGAIGIARVFAYGGAHGRPIHLPEEAANPDMTPKEYAARTSTGINHFYEKLLLLKDRMNTAAGRRIAEGRHRFMEAYLAEFMDEWEGKR